MQLWVFEQSGFHDVGEIPERQPFCRLLVRKKKVFACRRGTAGHALLVVVLQEILVAKPEARCRNLILEEVV